MKHTLHDNILGEIDYEGVRMCFEFQFPDGKKHLVWGTKFQAMKTGCYVYFDGDITYVVPPGWRLMTAYPLGKYGP